MTSTKSSVAEFLEAAGSKQPTPGGGAASALTGAVAAAMLEMTLNYSVGKKSLEAYQSELVPALEAATLLRKRFEALIEKDQVVYQKLAEAKKAGQGVKEAVDAAIGVPLEIAASGVEVLEYIDRVLNFINVYLLSDLAVSADLAMACLRTAIYNVRINMPELATDTQRIEVSQQVATKLQRGGHLIQSVSPRIWKRIEAGA